MIDTGRACRRSYAVIAFQSSQRTIFSDSSPATLKAITSESGSRHQNRPKSSIILLRASICLILEVFDIDIESSD